MCKVGHHFWPIRHEYLLVYFSKPRPTGEKSKLQWCKSKERKPLERQWGGWDFHHLLFVLSKWSILAACRKTDIFGLSHFASMQIERMMFSSKKRHWMVVIGVALFYLILLLLQYHVCLILSLLLWNISSLVLQLQIILFFTACLLHDLNSNFIDCYPGNNVSFIISICTYQKQS